MPLDDFDVSYVDDDDFFEARMSRMGNFADLDESAFGGFGSDDDDDEGVSEADEKTEGGGAGRVVATIALTLLIIVLLAAVALGAWYMFGGGDKYVAQLLGQEESTEQTDAEAETEEEEPSAEEIASTPSDREYLDVSQAELMGVADFRAQLADRGFDVKSLKVDVPLTESGEAYTGYAGEADATEEELAGTFPILRVEVERPHADGDGVDKFLVEWISGTWQLRPIESDGVRVTRLVIITEGDAWGHDSQRGMLWHEAVDAGRDICLPVRKVDVDTMGQVDFEAVFAAVTGTGSVSDILSTGAAATAPASGDDAKADGVAGDDAKDAGAAKDEAADAAKDSAKTDEGTTATTEDKAADKAADSPADASGSADSASTTDSGATEDKAADDTSGEQTDVNDTSSSTHKW